MKISNVDGNLLPLKKNKSMAWVLDSFLLGTYNMVVEEETSQLTSFLIGILLFIDSPTFDKIDFKKIRVTGSSSNVPEISAHSALRVHLITSKVRLLPLHAGGDACDKKKQRVRLHVLSKCVDIVSRG